MPSNIPIRRMVREQNVSYQRAGYSPFSPPHFLVSPGVGGLDRGCQKQTPPPVSLLLSSTLPTVVHVSHLPECQCPRELPPAAHNRFAQARQRADDLCVTALSSSSSTPQPILAFHIYPTTRSTPLLSPPYPQTAVLACRPRPAFLGFRSVSGPLGDGGLQMSWMLKNHLVSR